MSKIVISGTGLYAPSQVISNEELVASFNEYVKKYNHSHEQEIAADTLPALKESSSEFIVKASGIKRRHVVTKEGILDCSIMKPILPTRANNEPSIQCEMALAAAKQALAAANKEPHEIDAVILSSSNIQRPYPSIAVEIQAALGAKGYAYDMLAGCSSAVFGLQTIINTLRAKQATCVLMINPEILTATVDFHDRDCHFIFGDACTATIVETTETCRTPMPFECVDSKLATQFSNNVRNNFGFLNRCEINSEGTRDKLFMQQGRQVFKEVVPFAARFITTHLEEKGLTAHQLKRLWLHQANINMNQLIAEKVLGRPATQEEAPTILDEYGNTASAGILIAFHHYHQDLKPGDYGLICAFGAGYSVGSIIVKRLAM